MDDQSETVAFLSDARNYPGHVTAVDRIETHGALVFLAGAYVYKIKRSAAFSYMDFSTLAKRRAALLRELEVNKPNAPQIYLDVLKITRDKEGRLYFGGDGAVVEWVLRMHRFSQDQLLSHVVDATGLDANLADALAKRVAHYHDGAAVSLSSDAVGSFGNVIDNVAEALGDSDVPDVRAVAALCGNQLREALNGVASLLLERTREGLVRRCHGDLHLGNIVLWDGEPVLFDAIEFDETIATVDVLYDLAFLLMDLDQRGLRAGANGVLNRYLWHARDARNLTGLRALPFFMALRAGVRAMVGVQYAQQTTQSSLHQTGAHSDVRSYVAAVRRYLAPGPARLIAVGGFSGSGKTTVARGLAPDLGRAPGAVHLRSDLERKLLSGVSETVRLGDESYRPDVTRQVYAALMRKARLALDAGQSVVADAVFSKPEERQAIERVARDLGIGFQGIWLEAPVEQLVARVNARSGDASDATGDVVRAQVARGADGIGWTVVESAGSRLETLARARDGLSADIIS